MVGLTDVAHCDTCGSCTVTCCPEQVPNDIDIVVRGFSSQICSFTFGAFTCYYNCADLNGTYALQKSATGCCYYIDLDVTVRDINGNPALCNGLQFVDFFIEVCFETIDGIRYIRSIWHLGVPFQSLIKLLETLTQVTGECCNYATEVLELLTDAIYTNWCCTLSAGTEIEITAVDCGVGGFSAPQREARIVPIIDKPEDLPKEIEEWLTRHKN